jgi:hypothetical protein
MMLERRVNSNRLVKAVRVDLSLRTLLVAHPRVGTSMYQWTTQCAMEDALNPPLPGFLE